MLKVIKPKTISQNRFFEAYDAHREFMLLAGSAGTGKSFISIYKALTEVLDTNNAYKRLILIRSAVQTRDVGFTPGSLDEKMSIYEDPYHAICSTLFERKDAYTRLKEQGYIEFTSTTALRGMTFDNAIVIADECQNMTYHELNSTITRVGRNSKIIFVGDARQNDLIKKASDPSGLLQFMAIAVNMEEFTPIFFMPDDIIRSKLVKSWIIASERYG